MPQSEFITEDCFLSFFFFAQTSSFFYSSSYVINRIMASEKKDEKKKIEKGLQFARLSSPLFPKSPAKQNQPATQTG